MDCIFSELKEVEDTSLIPYVLESIQKQEIRSLYESFCVPERLSSDKEMKDRNEHDTYPDTDEEVNDTSVSRYTIRGQKEKEKEKQQEAFNPNIENNPYIEDQLQNQKTNDEKEIVEYWDNKGIDFSNVNAKEQLLAWLNYSSFLKPNDAILKAMTIACVNNKRKLNYMDGILKNLENESLLTVEEIDSYLENQKPDSKYRQTTESVPTGSSIPIGVELDLTAEDEYVEKAFLGSLMKVEYILIGTIIQPEQLESTQPKKLMRRMVELNRTGKNVDLITLTTLPDLYSFCGMSSFSEQESYADLEKFEEIEKLIPDLWKEREKRNILTVASAKVNKYNEVKIDKFLIHVKRASNYSQLNPVYRDQLRSISYISRPEKPR
jgi:DnaD/phage-associated family protein